MNLNKVTLIGNLTADPKVATLPSGQSVTTFGLATNYRWRDWQTKQSRSSVEFHTIVAWRRIGEVVAKYLKKGDRVFIEGRLQTRTWKGKTGAHKDTEVIASQLILLGKRSPSASEEKPNNELVEEEMSADSVPVTA